MQLTQAIPAVWVYSTAASYQRAGREWASFLTREQKARLEAIRQGRMLFDGQHREYFVDEGRTQFNFPLVRAAQGWRDPNRPDGMVQIYLRYNVLRLISIKSADLLFGESPVLKAPDPHQQDALTALAERVNLHELLYGAALDASYERECFLEACVGPDGDVYIQQLPADEVFPLGDLRPDRQYAAYVRYQVRNVGTDTAPLWLLLTTTSRAGLITRELYQLDEEGGRTRVTLDQWPLAEGEPPIADKTVTGLARNTITWIPNLTVRKQPFNDYDGAVDMQDAVTAKNSQVAAVLLKHADPKMAFPEDAFDESGNIRSDYDAFPFRDPAGIPQYITWDGQLDAAMKDRAFHLNQLLVYTETSPVLLGLKEGAAPDAYKKVRLEAFNSLTKAARKAIIWRAGVIRALAVAQELENTLPGVRYDRGPIGLTLNDGIPVDDSELANTLAIERQAGLCSRRRGVTTLVRDPAAAEAEIKELETESAAAAPATFGGLQLSPTGAEPGEDTHDTNKETTYAA